MCAESMHESVIQAVEESNKSCKLSIAMDGTWQKCGHSSQVGNVTVTTNIGTICVLDVDVM